LAIFAVGSTHAVAMPPRKSMMSESRKSPCRPVSVFAGAGEHVSGCYELLPSLMTSFQLSHVVDEYGFVSLCRPGGAEKNLPKQRTAKAGGLTGRAGRHQARMSGHCGGS
jgi:hypothetical protein